MVFKSFLEVKNIYPIFYHHKRALTIKIPEKHFERALALITIVILCLVDSEPLTFCQHPHRLGLHEERYKKKQQFRLQPCRGGAPAPPADGPAGVHHVQEGVL